MNEAETRAELIDPKLKACGWGVVEGSKVLREYNITAGKIQTGGGRGKREIADYVLVYKGIKFPFTYRPIRRPYRLKPVSPTRRP